jgi:hypothetical protein
MANVEKDCMFHLHSPIYTIHTFNIAGDVGFLFPVYRD